MLFQQKNSKIWPLLIRERELRSIAKMCEYFAPVKGISRKFSSKSYNFVITAFFINYQIEKREPVVKPAPPFCKCVELIMIKRLSGRVA